MRGVGGVSAEHAARRDDVDRRLHRLHRADLHRRGVGAQHRGAGRPPVDEERVPHAARRVAGAHVQRLEVVVVGLHLGPFGHLEAEPDEDVLEPLPRLRHRVQVAAPRAGRDLGEVEPLGFEPQSAGGRRELRAAGVLRRLRGGERLVHCLADGLSVVWRERAELALHRGQFAGLAEQVGSEVAQLVERRGGGKAGGGGGAGGGYGSDVRGDHGRSSSAGDSARCQTCVRTDNRTETGTAGIIDLSSRPLGRPSSRARGRATLPRVRSVDASNFSDGAPRAEPGGGEIDTFGPSPVSVAAPENQWLRRLRAISKLSTAAAIATLRLSARPAWGTVTRRSIGTSGGMP